MAAIDPLDEKRVDPRDLLPIPSRFSYGFGNSVRQEPEDIGQGIQWSRVYWVYGSGTTAPSEVNDPPCSGWSSCFILPTDHENKVRLFCPYSIQSWTVSKHSYEFISTTRMGEVFDWRMKERFQSSLPRIYAEHKRRGWTDRDYATMERLIEIIGARVPSPEEWAKLAPSTRTSEERVKPLGSNGTMPSEAMAKKPTMKTAQGSFKAVKPDSRKGQVLKFFLDGGTSMDTAVNKLGIQRNNLLSQLFLLRKDHGFDYKVSGDNVALTMPEGVTEFFA